MMRLSFLALLCLLLAPTAANAAAVVAPHRALYDMALASVKNGSGIAAATGQMAFEWGDSCDGWTVQQHMEMHFDYAEGNSSVVKSSVVTWEAKDGKSFRFNVRRTVDGQETESFRGTAIASVKSATGTYTVPARRKVALPPGTIFPSTHTAQILEEAAKGTKIFSKPVFDGSDEIGYEDVSVFIGAPSQIDDPDLLPGNTLLKAPGWPVRLAFFKPDSETGEPDYEMDMTLLSNGVVKLMRIDYGNFAVSGSLISLEALPAPGC